MSDSAISDSEDIEVQELNNIELEIQEVQELNNIELEIQEVQELNNIELEVPSTDNSQTTDTKLPSIHEIVDLSLLEQSKYCDPILHIIINKDTTVDNEDLKRLFQGISDFELWTTTRLGTFAYIALNYNNKEIQDKAQKIVSDYVQFYNTKYKLSFDLRVKFSEFLVCQSVDEEYDGFIDYSALSHKNFKELGDAVVSYEEDRITVCCSKNSNQKFGPKYVGKFIDEYNSKPVVEGLKRKKLVVRCKLFAELHEVQEECVVC